MIDKNKLFIIGFALFFVLFSIPGYGAERQSSEYVWVLDIDVIANDNGEVMIVRIGRFGPFRRYSWFRFKLSRQGRHAHSVKENPR